MNADFFKNYGFTLNNILHISPREAYELCQKGAILLDLRLELLFNSKRFDVPEMLYCHNDEIENYFHHLPTNRPVIIADAVGIHSKEVVEFLMNKGYTLVANLVGGIHDWERDGLPIIVDKDETMTGGCMCQLRTWSKAKGNKSKKS
ncbi:MAG: rhodanese-like domain-containing protein [Bacteroidetes bacterium HGW-Bacteroidetes-15]|nr:MAG: rhodanese-like domain-containing protein [Bacteroidetes bacterium HGW-Bacteroidetes-15]